MSQITQQICDGCGKILTGSKGIVKIHEPFITIKGSIGVGEVDPDTKWREFMFITPNSTNDLAFCDIDCLKAYIDTGTERARNRHISRLREEAEFGGKGPKNSGYDDMTSVI